jgi:hypothetical protein
MTNALLERSEDWLRMPLDAVFVFVFVFVFDARGCIVDVHVERRDALDAAAAEPDERAHDTVPMGTEPQRIAHEPLCIGDTLRDIDDVLDHIVDALK